MHKTKLLVCLLALLSASCTTTGSGKTVELSTVDTACQWVKPIRVAEGDKLSDGTARQILSLNKAWQSACPNVRSSGTATLK